VFTADVVKKQKDFVQPMHQQVLAGAATCIDCHKGIAHKAP
jgi:nitrate/TMAO reductase-like tetraheme cytochrome c subunit